MSGPPSAELRRDGTAPPAPVAHLPVPAAPIPERVEPRARLVRRLLAAAPVRAVALTAPAGYGKTALLEAWTRADVRPAWWIRVDRRRGSVVDALAALDGSVAELAAEPRDALLIVDDADAHGGAVAAQAQHAVARDLPCGVTLVLSGRTAPPRPFARLRSAWPVLELGSEDLALTGGEAAVLLRGAGIALEPAALATLMARTEGWPCGVRLAVLALAGEEDREAAVERFGGADRVVADYLADEVLCDLAPDRLAFLTDVAILDTLSGPVCDFVLQRQDSGGVLYDLGRSPVPIRPLDRAEERFRLHPLLAGMLRARRRRAGHERERTLHARASAYYQDAGQLPEAIDHAIAGVHLDRAATLLWKIAPSLLFAGGTDALREWLLRIGDVQVRRRPQLALTAALTALAHGERDQVERWVIAAERGAGGRWGGDEAWVEVAARLVRATVWSGEAATLRDRASAALALTPADSAWRPVCHLLRGVAHGQLGARGPARDDLDEGVRRASGLLPAIEALCLAELALQALFDGDVDEGALLAERARDCVVASGLDDPASCGLVYAVSGFARAYRGCAEDARADVEEAQRLLGAGDGVAPWYDAHARLALARAHLRLSDVTAARALTAEAARRAARIPDAVRLRAWLDDAWARADTFAVEALAGPTSLTTAELRVLRFLPSHLAFREIAERLHVSTNTVKTQAHAVYRKLDASSRSMAVARARTVGLLDP
ncbi:MAG TPA: LuxR C-terminal-related transcriptional regulator [Baekduia sp.]